ncbi:MAG: hypothetical protein ATN35_10460 [Epulopiscium sp. Nele67-Bin004]|nr:MAG: hypothetical protein ATN35_10460 [Epulopiscium sp. Nele67-Bin004]
MKKVIISVLILIIVGLPTILFTYIETSYPIQIYFDNLYGVESRIFYGDMLGRTQNSTAVILPVITSVDVPEIAKEVGESVVSITSNMPAYFFQSTASNLGSGVIFEKDNNYVYIVTNAHVIEGAATLIVNMADNKYRAQIVGFDSISDIAVIAIPLIEIPDYIEHSIKVATFADVTNLKVGDIAIAIGSPLDQEYYNTVTVGVVSAIDREMYTASKNVNFIQTDAAINPGNSGGALVGPTGEIIGINTAKLTSQDVEGIGFAIPSNDMLPIAYELLANGVVRRAGLQLETETVYRQVNGYTKIPIGVRVNKVHPNTNASKAGLQSGDIIVMINDKEIYTAQDMQCYLYEYSAGDIVEMYIYRDDSILFFEVQLENITS